LIVKLKQTHYDTLGFSVDQDKNTFNMLLACPDLILQNYDRCGIFITVHFLQIKGLSKKDIFLKFIPIQQIVPKDLSNSSKVS